MENVNLEGHKNRITGSRVTTILMKKWIFPIEQSGEARWWRVCYHRGLPRLVFIQCNKKFKKVCKFCNKDIVMKSLVVGINQTREKLKSVNLHLTKKHQVARKTGSCYWWVTSLWRSKSSWNFLWNNILSTLEATLLQVFLVLFVAISFIYKDIFWSI